MPAPVIREILNLWAGSPKFVARNGTTISCEKFLDTCRTVIVKYNSIPAIRTSTEKLLEKENGI